MTFTVIVPVRLGSTRLPSKPLIEINGKPMLLHVLQRARAAGAARVVAATDTQQLAKLATAAGFEAELTGACRNGTERAAQAASRLEIGGVIVNLQGDEPAVEPQLVAQVAQRAGTGGCDCATAAAPITAAQAEDPNIVKALLRRDNTAACFSRAPVPHVRAGAPAAELLGHVGLYAFAPGRLAQAAQLEPCAWEQAESLEQLRWLWHGWTVAVVKAASFSRGIDTPAALQAARAGAGA